MRLARALGSLPHLRRQFVPTARSRVVRGRLQWNLSTGVEQPAQEVSSVDVKATLARPDATSILTDALGDSRVNRGSRRRRTDSKPNPWSSFLRRVFVGRVAWEMAREAHRPSNRLYVSPSATARSNGEIATQTEAIARQFQHSH